MKAQTGDDLSNEIRQVERPVLIIHGDADTTVPIAFGRALFKGVKRARLSVLNDQGHGLIVNPVAQQVVVDWLRSD